MIVRVENRVARARFAHRPYARDDITDFARTELLGRDLTKLVVPDFIHLVHRFARAEGDMRAFPDHSVDDSNAGNRAPITVVIRVVDQRAERGVLVAFRRRHLPYDLLQQLRNANALLRAHEKNRIGFDSQEVGEFLLAQFRFGARQIDLVQNRDDLQARVHRQKKIGESLRLYPL